MFLFLFFTFDTHHFHDSAQWVVYGVDPDQNTSRAKKDRLRQSRLTVIVDILRSCTPNKEDSDRGKDCFHVLPN